MGNERYCIQALSTFVLPCFLLSCFSLPCHHMALEKLSHVQLSSAQPRPSQTNQLFHCLVLPCLVFHYLDSHCLALVSLKEKPSQDQSYPIKPSPVIYYLVSSCLSLPSLVFAILEKPSTANPRLVSFAWLTQMPNLSKLMPLLLRDSSLCKFHRIQTSLRWHFTGKKGWKGQKLSGLSQNLLRSFRDSSTWTGCKAPDKYFLDTPLTHHSPLA